MGAEFISTSVKTYRENMTSSLINSWSSRHDSYSGDWNTCSDIGKTIKYADKFSESVKKRFFSDKHWKEIEDKTNKWESTVWDLGVVGYEVWSVKKVTPKNKVSPQYKTMFVVTDDYGRSTIKHFDKVTDANIFAKRYTLEKGKVCSVLKTHVLVKGNEKTADFELVKKTYKSKPKNIKADCKLREIHYYYVSAFASC